MSANLCVFMGNLTRDPEIRTTPNGATVTKFGMAVSRTYTTKSGEKKDEVSFIDCEAWDKGGELIHRDFKKGSPIYIESSLKQDRVEKDGKKISYNTFRVNKFEYCLRNEKRDQNEEVPAETTGTQNAF